MYKANISDMAAPLDHADGDGLLRDNGAGIPRPCTAMGCCVLSGEHTFSVEQQEIYVECSSGVQRGVAYRVFRLSRTLSGLCGPENFIY